MADLNNLSPREQAHEKAQRIIMVTTASAEEADGDRNPMWCSKAFFGTFGDNFVMSTDLEGGQTEQSIPEMIEVAEEIISKLKEARLCHCLMTMIYRPIVKYLES